MGSPRRLCVSIAKSNLVLGSWLADSGFRVILWELPLADLGLSVLCHLALPFLLQASQDDLPCLTSSDEGEGSRGSPDVWGVQLSILRHCLGDRSRHCPVSAFQLHSFLAAHVPSMSWVRRKVQTLLLGCSVWKGWEVHFPRTWAWVLGGRCFPRLRTPPGPSPERFLPLAILPFPPPHLCPLHACLEVDTGGGHKEEVCLARKTCFSSWFVVASVLGIPSLPSCQTHRQPRCLSFLLGPAQGSNLCWQHFEFSPFPCLGCYMWTDTECSSPSPPSVNF